MFQGTRKKQKRTVIVMANTAQKLRKTRVRNNTELRTLKSRNCYATDDATAAQKDTVKASAIAVLRRNKERNSNTTGTETMRNNQRNNQPKVASEVAPVADQRLQQNASDFVRFCMTHENTFANGHCPVKHSRDPFTKCVGWQIKTKRETLQ
jgi:hypothetical protein